MATDQKTADFIVDQMRAGGDLRSRKMFGEYALYCNEKVITFICDDRLFLKVTEPGLKLLPEADHEPAYPGAKLSIVVPEDVWDDHRLMAELARVTAEALPRKK